MTAVGVVGVGSMGAHHARVYAGMDGVDLVGVADADPERARAVAADHGTAARALDDLLAAADAASVAVPTPHHHAVATDCIDAGVHTLVEKPLVDSVERGRDLLDRAEAAGVVLTAGHVERFNPAVETLRDVLADAEVIAVDARRLGPPLDDDRGGGDVVTDLMVHDLDLTLSLLDESVESVCAAAAPGGRHVSATLALAGGPTATFTASRATHRKVRRLSVTARDRLAVVDYLDQSVAVYRRSLPAFVADDDGLRYRHEQVVERPVVGSGEPLARELDAFVAAARGEREPAVSGREALAAVAAAAAVRDAADLGEGEP